MEKGPAYTGGAPKVSTPSTTSASNTSDPSFKKKKKKKKKPSQGSGEPKTYAAAPKSDAPAVSEPQTEASPSKYGQRRNVIDSELPQ